VRLANEAAAGSMIGTIVALSGRRNLARLSSMPKVQPHSWQLQDAKNRFSEVVDEAARSGPQIITRRGIDAAVVVSAADWAKLARRRSPLIEILRRAPRLPGGLDVTRSRDTGRKIEL
jgi:antitoxin Phd